MIEPAYFWRIVFFLAVGTLAIRGSIIFLSNRIKISDWWREIFSYIPAAILPAFIAPAVFFHEGHIQWMAGRERFAVLILATAVCYYTRNTLATISFGLFMLYMCKFLT